VQLCDELVPTDAFTDDRRDPVVAHDLDPRRRKTTMPWASIPRCQAWQRPWRVKAA
jgi:hypothetical protein